MGLSNIHSNAPRLIEGQNPRHVRLGHFVFE